MKWWFQTLWNSFGCSRAWSLHCRLHKVRSLLGSEHAKWKQLQLKKNIFLTVPRRLHRHLSPSPSWNLMLLCQTRGADWNTRALLKSAWKVVQSHWLHGWRKWVQGLSCCWAKPEDCYLQLPAALPENSKWQPGIMCRARTLHAQKPDLVLLWSCLAGHLYRTTGNPSSGADPFFPSPAGSSHPRAGQTVGVGKENCLENPRHVVAFGTGGVEGCLFWVHSGTHLTWLLRSRKYIHGFNVASYVFFFQLSAIENPCVILTLLRRCS